MDVKTENAAGKPLVSIIVPVCNVEAYLAQCLDAVCAQTLTEIEVIALDDGSTDSSPEILERYARADARIRVVSKPNEGYGATINRGMALARADWVGIVESDDWPEPTMFEKLYRAAVRDDPDWVKCDFFDHFDETDKPRGNLAGLPFHKPFDPADYPQIMLITPSTWASLYRKRFLEENGIAHRETPGASFQDASFSLKCLFAAKRCRLIREPLLHYRRDNPQASMKSADKLFAAADEFGAAREYFKRDPGRYERFIGWARLNEWHNYRWEYERIAPEGLDAFLGRVADEMREAARLGELRFELFDDEEALRLKILLAAGVQQFRRIFPERFYDVPLLHEGMPARREDFLVSVVIPAYNDEDYVRRAIDSCLAQTHKHIEVICVDDCSADGTLAAIRKAAGADPRVKEVALDRNSGEHDARAAGVRQATGDLLLFLDADDELTPGACALAAREYLRLPYDILQFADKVTADGVVSERKVREMTDYLRPRDGQLVGPEIVRRCFVEHASSHSAHSKAYHLGTAKRAFAKLGEYRADCGVDALEYFAIASESLVYRGCAGRRAYVYHLGAGMSSREGMTMKEFSRSFEVAKAVAGMSEYIDRIDAWERYGDAYREFRSGQISFLVQTWFEDVRPEDQAACMRELLKSWELGEVVDAACRLGSGAVERLRHAAGKVELTEEQAWKCGFADAERAVRDEYEKSASYRLGRVLSALPRKLLGR